MAFLTTVANLRLLWNAGAQADSWISLMRYLRSCGATIICVTKRPAPFRRRKLATVVRKAITSYYTEEEQQEIAQAAKRQRISKSSFVASAALKEARRADRPSSSK